MVIQYAHLLRAEISIVFDQFGGKESEIWACGGHVSTFSGSIRRFQADLPTHG
jgi:hypothetical protein